MNESRFSVETGLKICQHRDTTYKLCDHCSIVHCMGCRESRGALGGALLSACASVSLQPAVARWFSCSSCRCVSLCTALLFSPSAVVPRSPRCPPPLFLRLRNPLAGMSCAVGEGAVQGRGEGEQEG